MKVRCAISVIAVLIAFLCIDDLSAQGPAFGGSMQLVMVDSAGTVIPRDELTVLVEWDSIPGQYEVSLNDPDVKRTIDRIRDGLSWKDDTITYAAIKSPTGGYIPHGFRLVVIYDGDTMEFYYGNLFFDHKNFGPVPFLAGRYQVPWWYNVTAPLQTQSGPLVTREQWERLRFDRRDSLPSIAYEIVSTRRQDWFTEDNSNARASDTMFRCIRIAGSLREDRVRNDWEVQRTTNGGRRWEPVLWNIFGERGEVTHVGVCAADERVLVWITVANPDAPVVLYSNDYGYSFRNYEMEALPYVGDESVEVNYPYPLCITNAKFDDGVFHVYGYHTFVYSAREHRLKGDYILHFDLPDDAELREELLEELADEIDDWIDEYDDRKR